MACSGLQPRGLVAAYIRDASARPAPLTVLPRIPLASASVPHTPANVADIADALGADRPFDDGRLRRPFFGAAGLRLSGHLTPISPPKTRRVGLQCVETVATRRRPSLLAARLEVVGQGLKNRLA